MQEQLTTPAVMDLDVAVRGVHQIMAVRERHRGVGDVHGQGGDLAPHASPGLLVRHTVNYLLAAQLAASVTQEGPLLDVGSGVGVFSVWLAQRLERRLHLADHDHAVLAVARRVFPEATTHLDVADAPLSPVVTALEVIEHVPPAAQVSFVRSLMDRVAPGGVLACSTPDERGYLGGWSGYAPHIGILDFAGLHDVLARATGLPVRVWRVNGPGFTLSPLQRVGEPVVNRVWGMLTHRAPGLTGRLAVGAGRRLHAEVTPAPPDKAFTVSADPDGQGCGLFAAVHKPA